MSYYNESAATAIIDRTGKMCDVLRATTSGTDAYRNPNKSWSKVATERVARIYPYLRLWPGQEDSMGGEIDEDNPILIFSLSADIQDGDKVVYEGTEYRVRSITRMQTHARARSQKI